MYNSRTDHQSNESSCINDILINTHMCDASHKTDAQDLHSPTIIVKLYNQFSHGQYGQSSFMNYLHKSTYYW